MSANNAIYVLTVIEKFPEGYVHGKPYGERIKEVHFAFEDDVDVMGELTSTGKLTLELSWRLARKNAVWYGNHTIALKHAHMLLKSLDTEYGIICDTVKYRHE